MTKRAVGSGATFPVPGRAGVTLLELLLAAGLAVMLVGAAAGLFSVFSRAARHSQATVDLGNLLRSTAWQLKQDLTGHTCELAPSIAPATNSGYFEVIEGSARDATYAFDEGGTNLTGDTDDVLLFTTQALAEPYVGRFDDAAVESPFAEVAWFCRPLPLEQQKVPGTVLHNLHRRQQLVINYLGDATLVGNTIVPKGSQPFVDRSRYDVSLRQLPGATSHTALFPNSLGDLTKRENRFLRNGYSQMLQSGIWETITPRSFPFAFPLETAGGRYPPTGIRYAPAIAGLNGTTRDWEDVILTNVIAFDVRVYDPDAKVWQVGSTWLVPGDPGYSLDAVPAGAATGAYVDLGLHGGPPTPLETTFPPADQTVFQSRGVCVSNAPRSAVLGDATYDTWSRHYEFNEIDDDGDDVIDEGIEGIDSDGDGFPEYAGAQETSPPYPAPLRGLEVRIRCYEPVSKQVRQITVRQTFVR